MSVVSTECEVNTSGTALHYHYRTYDGNYGDYHEYRAVRGDAHDVLAAGEKRTRRRTLWRTRIPASAIAATCSFLIVVLAVWFGQWVWTIPTREYGTTEAILLDQSIFVIVMVVLKVTVCVIMAGLACSAAYWVWMGWSSPLDSRSLLKFDSDIFDNVTSDSVTLNSVLVFEHLAPEDRDLLFVARAQDNNLNVHTNAAAQAQAILADRYKALVAAEEQRAEQARKTKRQQKDDAEQHSKKLAQELFGGQHV